MAGAGLGFGSGFAQGLAAALQERRIAKREKARHAEDVQERQFQLQFPLMWKEAQESGDYEGFQSWLSQMHPEVEKHNKKHGSPFDKLGALLGVGRGKSDSPIPGGTPPIVPWDVGVRMGRSGSAPGQSTAPPLPTRSRPTTADEQQVIPGMPSAVEGPDSRLFGMRVATPEERTARMERDTIAELNVKNRAALGLDQQKVQQRLQQARELGMSPEAAIRFAATGQMPREDVTQTDAENFNAQIARFKAENGREPTMAEVNAMRQDWYKHSAAAAGQSTLGSFADYVARYAQSKGKTPEQLTAADIEAARKAYGQADDAARRPLAPIVIQTPYGPQIGDRSTGETKPFVYGAGDNKGTVVGRNPNATERKELGELQTLGTALEAVKAAYKPELVGPLAGRYSEGSQSIPGLPVPAGAADLSSKLAQVQNTLIYLRSGKQINEQEFTRLKKELPLMTDKPDVFVTKLANTESMMQTLAANRQANTGGAAPAAKGFSTEYQGKTYSFDSQRKLDAFKLQFGIK